MIRSLICALLVAIPSPNPGYRVLDQANLVSPAAESRLEALSAAVDKATSAEIAVVTVKSLDGMSIEQYSNELFNQWGIGKRGVNNGVLLLVARKERRARIEVGVGIEPVLTDGRCGEILARYLTPEFRKKNYEAGIVAAVEEIARTLESSPAESTGIIDSTHPTEIQTTAFSSMIAFFLFGLLTSGLSVMASRSSLFSKWLYAVSTVMLSATVIAVFVHDWTNATSAERAFLPLLPLLPFVAFGFITRRFLQIHSCKECGRRMDLLSEIEDDTYLEIGERIEEKIGSVDYKVWVCPVCLTKDKEAYIKRLLNYLPCPKCGRRAYRVVSTVETPATASSTGRERMEGTCKACSHTVSTSREIPMIDTTVVHYSAFTSDSTASSGGGGSEGYSSSDTSSVSSGGGDFGGGGGDFGGGSSDGGGGSSGD